MSTATLTSKGQITIPVKVRRELNLEAGDRLDFVQLEPGRFELVAATRSVAELKGMFGPSSRVVSLEQMKKSIAKRGAAAGLGAGLGQRVGRVSSSQAGTRAAPVQPASAVRRKGAAK